MTNNLAEPQLAQNNSFEARIMPYLIVIATSLALSASNIFMPSLTIMSRYFKQNSDALLMSVSIFFYGFAISGIIYGAAADYFGRRPTMLFGCMLFAIGCLTCMLATNLSVFIVGSLFEGIGGAASLIIGMATIQDLYTPQQSAKTLGWMGGLLAIMPALSPVLGGYFAILGWRASYIFLTTLSLVLLLFMYKFYGETHIPNKNKSGLLRRFFSSYFTVIKHKGFLRYATLYPILMVGSTAFLTALPFYIMNNLHFSPKACGYFIGFMTVGYTIGAFTASKLVTQYGLRFTLNIGIVLALLSSIALVLSFVLASQNTFFLIATFLFQAGIAMVHPPSTTTALSYFSDLRASASAVRGTFSMVGSALGATIAAALSQGNIILIAGVALISSSVVFFLNLVPKENPTILVSSES